MSDFTILKNKAFFSLFLLLCSTFFYGQTITPFLDPNIKFVKTMNSFHLLAERTDGKIWFTANSSKYTLRLLNEDGTTNSFSHELTDNINAIAPVANSKVLVGGNFTSYNSTTVSARIVRLHPDGTRDFDFSASANANEVTALYVLPSGKIMIGRNTQIQRLNENGSTDTSFATVTTNGKVHDFVVSANNTVIAIGDFTTVNGSNKNRIVSLQSDGTLDTSFDIGTGFNAVANSIRKSADNKLYVIGNFISYKGTTVNRIAKIDLNGNLDTAFHNANAGFDVAPSSLGVTQSNKLLVGGAFTQYNNQSAEDFIVINTTNGVQESNSGYVFESGIVKHIVPRTNGGFVFSGEFVKYNNAFTYQVFKTSDDINRIPSFQFGSDFSLHSFVDYIPIPSSYELSQFYGMSTHFTGNPIRAKRQNDKILISEVYINNKRYSLARFTNTGILDNTFLFDHSNLNLPSNLRYTHIRDFSYTPSGNIFLFLTNIKFNATDYSPSFLQLTAEGMMDNTFFGLQHYVKPTRIADHPGYILNYENTGYVRSDNKIVWTFPNATEEPNSFYGATYNDVSFSNPLNLLNANGDVDESFLSVPLFYGANSQYACNVGYADLITNVRILPLPNNETLVYKPAQNSYCSFGQTHTTGSEGIERGVIGRINANGIVTTRYSHLDTYSVSDVSYHNGYLYVGGTSGNMFAGYSKFFKKIDLATNNEVTFNHQLESSDLVYRSFIKDDKIYVLSIIDVTFYSGGSYTCSYKLKRLNMDGTLDTSFQTLNISRDRPYTDHNDHTGYGAYYEELEFIDNPNENSFMLISRFPFTINGTYYEQAFVKVSFDALSVSDNNTVGQTIKLYPNPVIDMMNISAGNEMIENIELLDMQGRTIRNIKGNNQNEVQVSVQDLPNAIYLVKVKTDKVVKILKVVKN